MFNDIGSKIILTGFSIGLLLGIVYTKFKYDLPFFNF